MGSEFTVWEMNDFSFLFLSKPSPALKDFLVRNWKTNLLLKICTQQIRGGREGGEETGTNVKKLNFSLKISQRWKTHGDRGKADEYGGCGSLPRPPDAG